MSQATDLSKMSNTEKYKLRVATAYGKDARPKFYKKGLAVAQGLDAKQTAPKGKASKRTVAKTSGK